MKTFLIDGVKKQIPEKWEEVTFGTYLRLIGLKDDVELLSVLLDIPVADLMGKRIQGLGLILPSIRFMKKQPICESTPVYLKDYELPQDITDCFVEQYEDTKTEIRRVAELEDLRELTRALALYAAIYIQGSKEDYNKAKALELAEKFNEYPCTEVMAAGSFFQAKYLSMQSGLSINFLRRDIVMKKSRPVLTRFLKRLGSMLHLTR